MTTRKRTTTPMTETIHATAAASEPISEPVPTVEVVFRQPLGEPIVIDYKGKRKKNKGGSRMMRDAQRTEARLAKISEKAARALADGAETYNQARKKSASERKYGPTRFSAEHGGRSERVDPPGQLHPGGCGRRPGG